MVIFNFISGLALLAAAACLALIIIGKRRSQKQNAAVIGYISRVEKDIKKVSADVEKLKSGTEPSYELQKAATDAVNDFNKGITAILGFDPYTAYQKEKERERMGGDVG